MEGRILVLTQRLETVKLLQCPGKEAVWAKRLRRLTRKVDWRSEVLPHQGVCFLPGDKCGGGRRGGLA
jgi:hypothetical protein